MAIENAQLEKFNRLKSTITQAKAEKQKLDGTRQALMKQLTDAGIEEVADADAEIVRLRTEIANKTARFTQRLNTLCETLGVK